MFVRYLRPMSFGRHKVGKLRIFLKLKTPLMPSSLHHNETGIRTQSPIDEEFKCNLINYSTVINVVVISGRTMILSITST